MTATEIVTVKTDSISFDLSKCRATWLYLSSTCAFAGLQHIARATLLRVCRVVRALGANAETASSGMFAHVLVGEAANTRADFRFWRPTTLLFHPAHPSFRD